jgi:hypothetical protein
MDLHGRGAMVTSAHVLAAAPNALILEHMDWWQPRKALDCFKAWAPRQPNAPQANPGTL